jgi:hypothetical protein
VYNDGPAAGQTIAQFHFHIIPRYAGDVPDPRGGIRHIIPAKARYWEEDAVPGEEHFARFESPASLAKPCRWTRNDDTDRHDHSLRPLTGRPLDLVL